MRLADQHIHCECSMDSETPMRTMAESALAHGASAVCFTDHVDLDDGETGKPDPRAGEEREKARTVYAELCSRPVEGIDVRLGVELGELHHDPERARKIAADPALDLVLGSLHNLRGTPDFYFLRFSGDEECREWNRKYLAELWEMTNFTDCFDIMAHVGYTSRYMKQQGFDGELSKERNGAELTEIFRALIRKGRGIEVNVSGLRSGHTTYPNASVLSLYRELGGELVTVGSDAHTAEDAAVRLKDGYELLRTLGFRYAAEFIGRKPEFMTL